MAGLTNYGCTGVLTINSVALACPAWDIPKDIGRLWNNRQQRGSNRLVGGASGRRARRRRYDETTIVLGGIVIGHADRTGDPVANAIAGLIANQDYLVENLVDPLAGDGDVTLAASLTIPGQSARTANVQVELDFGQPRAAGTRYAMAPFSITLTIPTPGYFA